MQNRNLEGLTGGKIELPQVLTLSFNSSPVQGEENRA